MSQPFRKGQELELEVEKLAFGGKALARVNGFVVFVEDGIPGQRLRARIVRKKRQFAEARPVEVIEQSPDYVEPFCRHFGVCGGCKWQNLPYDQQLHWKRKHVLECLEHLAAVDEAAVEPTVPSPRQRYYRNKMEYTFSDRRWLSPEEIADTEATYDRSFALGMHVRGFFDRVFDVEQCFLQSRRSVGILRKTREWCRQSGLPSYNTRSHKGFWRFLVLREGKHTDQTLVHIVTAPHADQNAAVDRLAQHLLEHFPDITTIVHSISSKKAQVAMGDTSRTVLGPGAIEERFGHLRFRISAHSFFQTNPYAAEKLYQTVLSLAELRGDEEVWDLYCGTGSIALFMAPHVHRVTGFEIVEEAVEDAYGNCELNSVENCRFRSGDLKDLIQKAQGIPDVVVTDPPRAGMHPKVVKALLELRPRRIVAVSCNPSTLARDLEAFLEGYTLKCVRPFDFFPHTPHIECVVQLNKK